MQLVVGTLSTCVVVRFVCLFLFLLGIVMLSLFGFELLKSLVGVCRRGKSRISGG